MNSGGNDYRRYGIALLRVTLGAYFIAHAWYGWEIYGVGNLAGLNAKLGVPFPAVSAWLLILGHLVGGVMLLLGFYTRLGALINLPIMAGAVFLVHRQQGFFVKGIIIDAAAGRAIYGGYEYALFLLIAAVAFLLLGGGPLALKSRNRKSPISLD